MQDSDFGLGGTVGELGLLSDPVMDLKDGQYDSHPLGYRGMSTSLC